MALSGPSLSTTISALVLVCNVASAETFPLPPPGVDIIGQVRIVVAKQEDTLLDIARSFNLGYNEITAANPGVDAWVPGEGTRIYTRIRRRDFVVAEIEAARDIEQIGRASCRERV